MLKAADIVLFAIVAVNALYLAIFAAAALAGRRPAPPHSAPQKRIAILIPAYKEDKVIGECAASCIGQQYPKELYETVVISDSMQPQTDEMLHGMGATVIRVSFANSTKSKALNAAMQQLDEVYDLALVLDGDNVIEPQFLAKLNDAFCADPSPAIIQAHRCAKNANTSMALLDAVSEEVNNTIFRLGHANMGLSAALIGSGMCFDYALFKRTMAGIDAVGGFDRALELTLLEQRHRIGYLPDAIVLDEKIQRHSDFSRQRRRWMSAQAHYMRRFIGRIPHAVRCGNVDFCDKMFQQMSLPRLILLGSCFLMAAITLFVPFLGTWKWWAALAVIIAALAAAVPRHLVTRRLALALLQLPYTFTLMVWNLLRMRGANKKFIHTPHGIDSGDKID